MSERTFEYVEPKPVERSAAERILKRGTPAEIERVLISVALHEQDVDWSYSVILGATAATDGGVRGTAILCLGHLARIHKRLPDRQALSVVRTALSDADEYVRGQAHNAASDIEMFIPAFRGQFPDR